MLIIAENGRGGGSEDRHAGLQRTPGGSEDVLETYKLPFDPVRPVVYLDETNRQLIGETRKPLPAQMETGILSRQCLNRRIGTIEGMSDEVAAWVTQRNKEKSTVHWQYS
jgi:hypothetical protein